MFALSSCSIFFTRHELILLGDGTHGLKIECAKSRIESCFKRAQEMCQNDYSVVKQPVLTQMPARHCGYFTMIVKCNR